MALHEKEEQTIRRNQLILFFAVFDDTKLFNSRQAFEFHLSLMNTTRLMVVLLHSLRGLFQ